MDHTSGTPKRSTLVKRRKHKPTETDSFPAAESESARMETDAAPEITGAAPEGTGAASVLTAVNGELITNPTAPGTVNSLGTEEFAKSLNTCTSVEEVVGPPISQQVCTVTVHVQPRRFPANYFDSAGDAGNKNKDNLDEKYYRCPPHTIVYTDATIKPDDGVPRVLSHCPDAKVVSENFRFVGVTMEGRHSVLAPNQSRSRLF